MKPNSMSIKEWLIKRLSLDIMVSESIIKNVIGHQFDSANDALACNDSVEISGFGKFFFNKKRAKKKLEGLERNYNKYKADLETSINEEERRKLNSKITIAEHFINNLKPRIHEH